MFCGVVGRLISSSDGVGGVRVPGGVEVFPDTEDPLCFVLIFASSTGSWTEYVRGRVLSGVTGSRSEVLSDDSTSMRAPKAWEVIVNDTCQETEIRISHSTQDALMRARGMSLAGKLRRGCSNAGTLVAERKSEKRENVNA